MFRRLDCDVKNYLKSLPNNMLDRERESVKCKKVISITRLLLGRLAARASILKNYYIKQITCVKETKKFCDRAIVRVRVR